MCFVKIYCALRSRSLENAFKRVHFKAYCCGSAHSFTEKQLLHRCFSWLMAKGIASYLALLWAKPSDFQKYHFTKSYVLFNIAFWFALCLGKWIVLFFWGSLAFTWELMNMSDFVRKECSGKKQAFTSFLQ